MAEHMEPVGVDVRDRLESVKENLAILIKQTRGDVWDYIVNCTACL